MGDPAANPPYQKRLNCLFVAGGRLKIYKGRLKSGFQTALFVFDMPLSRPTKRAA
ncbi:hypothetical protein [Kingella potus]|uniref:hypothetical protein n=1 Tax=Kingella potus TaxID=265175 RepID=UPI001FD09C4C|nr:hypothetical protein [Kingella potus]UOP00026.1 hypothetical protein LVJ84_08415 [Kingella potus]